MSLEDMIPVGRPDELAAVLASARGDAGSLLLEGEAGIGKTVLWEAAVQAARAAGARVLVSRPGEAERDFSLSVLGDLVQGIDEEILADLPEPQHRALRAALLVADPDDAEQLEPRSVAVAFLSTLRLVAARGRVVVAVDDVQWVDEASAVAISFVGRRLEGEPVTFLFCLRSGSSLPARMRLPAGLERIEVGPLGLGAMRRLLSTRSESRLSRQAARRVHEASGGNPFFALELARALDAAGGRLDSTGELPVPRSLDELIGDRIRVLSPGALAAVLATALAASPSGDLVAAAAGDEAAVAEAEAARLLRVDGRDVRLEHPLIGTVARAHATASQRRAAHRALSSLLRDPEQHARHLAAATDPPDPAVAVSLADAAARARSRGAAGAAAELAEEAWRFTPDGPDRSARLLTAADDLFLAGRHDHARQLLESELPSLPPGPARGWALHLCASGELDTPNWEELAAAALRELEGEPALRAAALAEASHRVATVSVEVERAYALASEACELARATGDDVLQQRCTTARCWPASMLGLADAAELGPTDRVALWDDSGRIRALWHMWRGEVARARPLLEDLLRRAYEAEQEWTVVIFVVHLFELESRVGDAAALAARLAELEAALAGMPEASGAADRGTAALAALRGDRSGAEAAAARVVAAEDVSRWHPLEARRVCGRAALVDGAHTEAVALLRAVVAETDAAGARNPGVFPAAPDLVEALVRAGELDEAERELERLDEVGRQQDHPWALAGVARGRGQLHVARGDGDAAEALLLAALEGYRRLDLRLDEARTLLELGRARRVATRRREARETIETALAAFEQLGAGGFAAQAREELARVSGRRAGDGLTPAEEQVARLAIDGLTNREIADSLVLTVRTVESHLTRVYAKLGVRSRAALARRGLATSP